MSLAKFLDNSKIKVFSPVSFPAGHALFSIFWGIMCLRVMPSRIGRIAFGMGIFMCLPRLISGAHWMSDVLFSGFLAFVLYEWAAFLALDAYGKRLIQSMMLSRNR